MGVEFTENELYCFLHILEREKPKMHSENSVTNIQESPIDRRSQSGLIIYKDLYTLVKNYIKKEKMIRDSERLGLDYRVLTKPTFEFLLKIKQAMVSKEGKTLKLKSVLKKVCQSFGLNETQVIEVIDFEEFFDQLFVKFQIMCPSKNE